jgi:hypothetical protein
MLAAAAYGVTMHASEWDASRNRCLGSLSRRAPILDQTLEQGWEHLLAFSTTCRTGLTKFPGNLARSDVSTSSAHRDYWSLMSTLRSRTVALQGGH